MKRSPFSLFTSWLMVAVLVLLAGCATPTRRDSLLIHAERSLHSARSMRHSPEKRAGYYLDAVREAGRFITDGGRSDNASALSKEAQEIYNTATAEVTALLRQSGPLWSSGTLIPSPAGNGTYRLRINTPGRNNTGGLWGPNTFTQFKPAEKIRRKRFRKDFRRPGYGGALVGVRDARHLGFEKERFAYQGNLTAAVTATLTFHPAEKTGQRPVSITLYDPSVRESAPILGKPRPLAADFTAPYAFYPQTNELIQGILSMIQVEKYINESGLYMLQPYDPERIPVIFIHGLASTPQMWFNVINEIEGDEKLRGRCQYWVVSYPSGTPTTYAAMRLREDLAAIEQQYPMPLGYVLVGHSMGGLVSRMQASDTGRILWDDTWGKNAEILYEKLPPDNLIKRTLIFDHNPHIDRLIFICVPHRGSELALGTIGAIATRLISLPLTLVNTFQDALGSSLNLITGNKSDRWPTSIQSLSPNNSSLRALARMPIKAPYNSIIGDRGRGDTPNSSDGVVPYWSSHLDGAESELIVPGPHGSYQLPETVDELRRILTLQLQQPAKPGRAAPSKEAKPKR